MAITKVTREMISSGIDDNSNATAITIDSSENVGIGVVDPSDYDSRGHKLVVGEDADSGFTIASGSSSDGRLVFATIDQTDLSNGSITYDHSADTMDFETAGSGRLRISGNNLHLIGGGDARIQLGTSGTGNAAVSNNTVHIRGDGDDMKLNAAGNGKFIFEENGTQRMEINSVGQVTMGSTSHADDILYLLRAGAGKIIRFYKDGSEVGYIGTENAHTSVPSDRDFKKDISDLTFGLDFVKSLNPKTYRHKVTDSNEPLSLGLIAQEVEASLASFGVVKNSTSIVQHTPTEDEKQSNYWMNNESLIPVLIKGMKEQQTIIDDLKARIKTLEDA